MVQLSPKTLDLLGALLVRRGQLVTFQDLRTAVWSGRPVADTEIGFYITILRDALGDALATTWIEVVDTRGYRFAGAAAELPPRPLPPPPEPEPEPEPRPEPPAPPERAVEPPPAEAPVAPPLPAPEKKKRAAPKAPVKTKAKSAPASVRKIEPEPEPVKAPVPVPLPEPTPEPALVVPPPEPMPEPELEPWPPLEQAPAMEPEPVPSRTSKTPAVWLVAGVVVIAGLVYLGSKGFGGGLSAPVVDEAPPAALVKTILVVPFRASSTDTHLGAAMADALQVRLRGVFAGRVAQAVAPAPGEDPQKLGARLDAEAVVTGSIEQAGTTLRMAVELVRVSDGQRLSSMVGEADASQLFSLQDQAASHLALVLRPDLMPTERGPLTRQDAATPEAYQLFIQARDQWRHRSRESVAEAIRLYEHAIQRDPRFVRAYAELAAAYSTPDTRTDPLIQSPRAKSAAEKAVALDKTSAQAHAALALVRYRFEWRWTDAETEFAAAIAADPHDAFTRHQYGLYLHAAGRTEEALAELARALESEPDSPATRADMVAPLLRAGRTTDARAAVAAVYAIDPAWPTLDQLNADVYAAEGHVGESVASLWRALLARGVLPGRVDALRAAYRAGGVTAMLERRAAQLEREVEDGPSPPSSYFLATELALTHAALKHRDETLHWLAVAIDLREEAPMHMRASAAFDFVRADPQFSELLRRAKIE